MHITSGAIRSWRPMRSRTHRSALQGALLLLFGATAAHAQRRSAGDGRSFHTLVLTTGMTSMSVGPLNAVLTNNRFAGLSSDGISYGASAYYAFGKALLGADVARTTFGEEGLSNGRSDDLNATQLLATASYALHSTAYFNVFPTLGVGVGQFDVTLRDRAGGAGSTTAAPTFDEIAQNPGASSTLSGHHLLYSVGGGADWLITRSAAGNRGVVFGVRAGMLLAPNRTTWTSGGRGVIAGPDGSAAGPFLRVGMGIGGR